MATAAQCIANVQNAKSSTGPKTEEGKAKVAMNGLSHGLFAAYEHLIPTASDRVNQFVEELHEGLSIQCAAFEDIIRQYAIAKWRSELFHEMEASFFSSALADERANPESASMVELHGDGILLGRALRHDAEGPNVFSKLMRYESRVSKELRRASESYQDLLRFIANRNDIAKPISGPRAVNPQPPSPEAPPQTPRNAPCPCGSGDKFKRCCGDGAPAVLCV